MRITYPRTPTILTVGRKTYYVLPEKQMEALKWVAKLGLREEAPDGTITATGDNRKHIYSDLLPLGFLDMTRPTPGVVDYKLTAMGKAAVDMEITMGSREHLRLLRQAAQENARRPEPATDSSLLSRQRSRAQARQERSQGRGRRAA